MAPEAVRAADVPGVAAVLAAGELDVARGVAELRARPSALGATVLAELPVVHVLVVQRRVAQGAEAGVAYAIRLEPRGLVDAEADARVVNARGDGGAQRVVGVVDQGGLGREPQRLGDHVLRVVDLAVAVELVPEEVKKDERAGPYLRQDAHGVELVALEGAEAALLSSEAAASRHHGGGDARLHVVAGAVAHHVVAGGGEPVGYEPVGGRLSVGPGDHDGAVEVGREVGDDVRIELERDGAGGVAAAAVKHAGESPARGVRRGAGQKCACTHSVLRKPSGPSGCAGPQNLCQSNFKCPRGGMRCPSRWIWG